MSEVMEERVLVVPTEVFHRLGHFQGFCGDVDKYVAEMFRAEHFSYRPRREVEEDPSFKQLIPYVLFCYQPPEGSLHVFRYTRGKGMGEGRLHAKKSVGIGGHISSVDAETASTQDAYDVGMRRELEEEVVIETPYESRCVGLINDDETEVGKVHLGVVYRFDVETPNVHPREEDLTEAGFYPVDQMLADLSGYETWSSICLDALFRK